VLLGAGEDVDDVGAEAIDRAVVDRVGLSGGGRDLQV
jgi:hypothetical protein